MRNPRWQIAAASAVLVLTTLALVPPNAAATSTVSGDVLRDGRPTIRIMPCGDSITYDNHSGDTRPDSLRTGYRQPLWLMLEAGGYDVDFVGSVVAGQGAEPDFDPDNEGHPGWRDDQIADNIYGWLVATPADIVLLHIGTNSLNTSPDDVEDILDEIDRYEADHSAEVTVLLARIINRMNHTCPDGSTTTTFNDNVESMAEARITLGDRIVIVPMECGAGMDYRETPTGDMYDNLHPTDDGYAKMAALWYQYLQPLLPGGACPEGMTHYWRFEETGGPPYADSHGDDDAGCTDCPAPASGIVGNALEFDGLDDEVTVPNDGSWDWASDGSFTVEFWMMKDTGCGGTVTDFNEVIVGRDDSGTNLHWWVGVVCGSSPQGRAAFQLRDTSGAGDAIYSSTILTNGAWHHVAAVRDGEAGMNRIYVDGAKEDSLSISYANGFGGATGLEIGFMTLSAHYRYEGIVDEVATYDRALTDAEIAAHYTNGLSGVGYCSADPADPAIVSSPVTEARTGRPYRYDVDATGHPAPTYALTTAPSGMEIDTVSGLITWIPALAHVGPHDVEVTATNASRGTDTQSFTVTVADAGICPDDISHYWKLDDGSGATAADDYEFLDGTLHNGATWVAGTVGGAAHFNGTDQYITVPDDASLDWGASSSFSIEVWARFTNVSSRNKVMIGRDDRPGGQHWWLGAKQNTGVANFNLLATDDGGVACTGTTALNDGEWHHIVAVRDNDLDENRLYVDGDEEDVAPYDYAAGFDAPTTLGIGYMAYSGTPDYFYEGDLDEIALYDRVLSVPEIEEHYANGLVGIGYCEGTESAPDIISTPVYDAVVGQLYTYDVDATGSPAPTYSLGAHPEGMEIDSVTGLITWTPDVTQEGPHSVEAIATNSARATDTQSFTVDVLEAPETYAIMPLGDSITDGAAGSSDDTGYRRSLYQHLTDAGYLVDFVGSQTSGVPTDFDRDHEGHGGWHANQIRDNVIGWLTANPADIVLLHIGTNDVSGSDEDVDEVEAILDNIDTYEASRGSDVTVYVARIILRDDSKNPQTIAFNEAVEAMVEARILGGDDLVMVDMENALAYPDDLADTVHPNDNGYEVMADTWFAAIDARLSGLYTENVVLASSSGNDYDTDDLLVTYDLGGGSYTSATAWYVDGAPIMAAYLPMEAGETHALEDRSGNGLAAVPSGDPAWGAAAGHDGHGAFVFDGDDDLSLGEHFPTFGSYTKTAWVYRTGSGANGGNNIISGDENPGGHALWAPDTYGNKLSAGHNQNWDIVQDSAALALDTWYFVAVTYDYGTDEMALYKNGAEVDRNPVGEPDVSDATISIGSFGSGNGWMWQGTIDDPRVYSRALSGDQIAAMYAGGMGDRDVIVADETSVGDEWHAMVTPFSETSAGASVASNALTILSGTPTPPSITSTPSLEATVGWLYSYDVDATGSPPPTYSLGVHPDGMEIDEATGLVTWTPTVVQLGPNGVEVVATNAARATDTQSFTVTVEEAPPCPEGMISYWKLDEAAGPDYADLMGANDGSSSNAPTSVEGTVGGAQAFDGTGDRIDIPADASFDWGVDSSFSIEYWMRKDTPCGGSAVGDNEVIVGRDDDSGPTDIHWWTGPWCSGTPQGSAVFQLRDENREGDYVAGTTVITDGEWHHIVAVRDGVSDTNRIYVDGDEEGKLYYDYGAGFSSATAALEIGHMHDAFYYEGEADEIAIYDRALTPTEIEEHYTNGLAGHGYCESTGTEPVITTTPATEVVAGEVYAYDADATGTPVPSFSLGLHPDGMTIDDMTGEVAWATDGGDVGPHDVEVIATNTAGADTQAYVLTVTPAPEEPVITTTPATEVVAGEVYAYDADATGTPVPSFSLGLHPDGMTIDDVTGEVAWATDGGDVGPHDVEVVATNTAGADTQAYVLTVTPAPTGPTVYCAPDTLVISGVPTGGTISVEYVDAARALLYSYSIRFTWRGAVATTAPGDAHEGDLLSSAGSTFFDARTTGADEITVDCALLGPHEGVAGPGTLFTIDFAAAGAGTTAVDIEVVSMRDHLNHEIPGVTDEDGAIAVSYSPPSVNAVHIENLSLPATDKFVKDGDAVRVTAELTYDDPAFGVDNVTADLTGLGGGAAVPADDLTLGVATWDLASVTCAPQSGTVTVTVTAEDTAENSDSGSDTIIADNASPDSAADLLAAYQDTVEFDVTYHATDATSGVSDVELWYRLDGGAYQLYGGVPVRDEGSFSFGAPAEGTYDYYTVAVDSAGNREDDPVAPDCSTIVDITPPEVSGVGIVNVTLDHTNDFVKDTDELTISATVTDGDPAFGSDDIEADLTGFGGGAAVHPESYDGSTATWTVPSASCTPSDGTVAAVVSASDAAGNEATASDDITADNTPPEPPFDFAITSGHETRELAWTLGAEVNLMGVCVAYDEIAGDYPLYDGLAAAWPDSEAAALYPGDHDEGTILYDGAPVTSVVDDHAPRGIRFYHVFSFDIVHHFSRPAACARECATNYWLGDVTDGRGGRGYDGVVDFEDIILFSIHYGETDPAGIGAECDVGPTVHPDYDPRGLPMPDGAIDYEDLMVFAMNYGAAPPSPRAIPLLAADPAGRGLALALEPRGIGADGCLELALRLEGNAGDVKGVSATLAFEPSELEFVSAGLGASMTSPLGDVFFRPTEGKGAVRLDLALLGRNLTIGGCGEIATLRFRALSETYGISITSADVRGAGNERLDAGVDSGPSGEGFLPTAFRLHQNTPNPFNPVTAIAYDVPVEARVAVRIYDVSGRRVRTLVDREARPGRHVATWNGRSDDGTMIASGIYFCEMEADGFRNVRKMLLLK